MMSNCEAVIFPLVSWVRCGVCLFVSIPDLCSFSYYHMLCLCSILPVSQLSFEKLIVTNEYDQDMPQVTVP